MVSNAIPQGGAFFKNTVRAHTHTPRCREFSEHLNKLLEWNIGVEGKNGEKKGCLEAER